MSYVDFSSWPRDQEMTFVVYEQRAAESQKKAFTLASVFSLIVLVFAIGIYAGVKPEEKDMTKDMNMSNLSKKPRAAAPTPAPSAAPAAAPAPTEEKKEAAPAEEKKDEAPAAEEKKEEAKP